MYYIAFMGLMAVIIGLQTGFWLAVPILLLISLIPAGLLFFMALAGLVWLTL